MTKPVSISARIPMTLAAAVALAVVLHTASPAASGQTAAAPAPGVPAPAAPQSPAAPVELKVWNSDILDTETGAPTGGALGIALFAPRNGTASGKVMVGGRPVAGLKASMSELKQGASAIPAASVRVRYGAQWDGELSAWGNPRGAGESDFEKNGVVEQYRTIYDLSERKWNKTAPEGHKWFIGSGWAEQTAKLFAVAGEVAKKTGGGAIGRRS